MMFPSRILVADSSPLVRERLVRALVASLPLAQITEASTGGGVMEAARNFAPDVLLLDARLADAVADFIPQVKAEGTPGCQVVVLAWESAAYAARCVTAGAFAVVDKAEPDLVVTAVVGALAARRSRPHNERPDSEPAIA